MDKDGTVVISDFGVAALVKGPGDRTSERRTFVGTPCWMAPEVMEQSQAYDEKADIWSLGITALELAKGYAPYARLNPMAVMIQTIRDDPPSLKTYEMNVGATTGSGAGNDQNGDRLNHSVSGSNKFSRHFKEVVGLCLQKNPKLRPSAATLLSRSFFTKAKDKSVLVRDLLEGIPIPGRFLLGVCCNTMDSISFVDAKDMGNSSRGRGQKAEVQQPPQGVQGIPPNPGVITSAGVTHMAQEQPSAKGQVARFLNTDGGQSFMPGATWEFDDESLQKMKKTPEVQNVSGMSLGNYFCFVILKCTDDKY